MEAADYPGHRCNRRYHCTNVNRDDAVNQVSDDDGVGDGGGDGDGGGGGSSICSSSSSSRCCNVSDTAMLITVALDSMIPRVRVMVRNVIYNHVV